MLPGMSDDPLRTKPEPPQPGWQRRQPCRPRPAELELGKLGNGRSQYPHSMKLFRLTDSLCDPEMRGAVLAIDETRREIVSGRIYALRFPDGRLGIARVIAEAPVDGATDIGAIGLDQAHIVGELLDWWTEPVTRH